MSVVISRVRALPPSFQKLREASVAEEFQFLNRLEERWREERYDDDALATIRMAFDGDEALAIGAQTYDEYDPAPRHRRMRHFYVLPCARRIGVGRQLAQALIVDAFERAPRLRLRATHASSTAFWEMMGFARIDADRSTHEMRRP